MDGLHLFIQMRLGLLKGNAKRQRIEAKQDVPAVDLWPSFTSTSWTNPETSVETSSLFASI
jgi:hypothetical protein